VNILDFSRKYRLKVQHDRQDGTSIIAGRRGQIYQYKEDELAVMFMPGESHPRLWNSQRRTCVSAGMVVRQNGDSEGVLSFDALDKEQVRLAIRLAGVRRRRKLSPEHKAKLRDANPALIDRKPLLQRAFEAENAPEWKGMTSGALPTGLEA
jgi:hypothetical protein